MGIIINCTNIIDKNVADGIESKIILDDADRTIITLR